MSEFWTKVNGLSEPALICSDGRTVSYGELYDLADSFAATLAERSLVFLCCGNNLETVAAYLGCLRHRHVCLLISKDMNADMLGRLCDTYRPNYLYRPDAGEHYHTERLHSAKVELHPSLAVLLSTSGSTGSPKLVRLTADNINANARAIAEYLELSPQERPVTNLPFYYSYGLSVLNSHLHVGAALLLTEASLISPSFWKFCDAQNVTSLAGVPYTYDMLEAVGFRKRPMPTLAYLTQAGGRMEADKVRRYADWAKANGKRFYVMYGQTEATARMSYLPPHQTQQKPGSIGIAIPGGSFSLADSEGNLINETEHEGELLYSGANVCMGYAEQQADLALGDTNHGTLHTGDVAKRDSDGYYYITGRLKRFLKIAGNRFSLDELDSHFKRMGIEAVCGGTDGKLRIAITDAATKEAVVGYLKSTWHLMRTQFSVEVVQTIPRSATGKILYADLFAENLT